VNVRWIKWSELLQEAGVLLNLDAEQNQIEPLQARQLAQAVNQATAYAWKYHAWECACWVMRVLAGAPGSNLLEPGYAVLQCYAEDPLAAWDDEDDPKTVAFRAAQGTVRTLEVAADETLFYMVRTAPPRFGGEARDNSLTYAPGALVYDASTGECWRSTESHSGTALPAAWSEWVSGEAVTGGMRRRRNGVLYTVDNAHTTSEDTEPAYGAAWGEWLQSMHVWAPQRLPEFLLPAVLAGARAWLESPSTAAMQEAMTAALDAEVQDHMLTRSQRFADGRANTIL